MTTPNMVTAPDGAYIIGGGEWKYGQSLTEELAHALLLPPMPTPANALALIADNLSRLPLEALKVFQPFVPNSTDEMFLTIEVAVETIIGIFMDPISFLKSIDFTTWTTAVFGPLNTIVNQLLDIFQGNVVVPFNTAIANVVTWVNSLGLSAILLKFETFLTGITNIDSWLVLFKEVIDFFLGITNRTAWMPVFKNLVDVFVTLTTTVGANLWTVVTGVITTFATLFASLNTTVWTVINEILTFFAGLTNRTNWLAAFKSVVDTFKSLFDSLGASVWTVLAEIIQFFQGYFTGAGSVIEWIKNNILKLPSFRLFGQIPDYLMGVVNIGNLTSVPINLLLSPGFENTASVSPVDGWSWDSTQNATGTGGSAKVVLDGYNKELSHQTVVNVAAGDAMQLSAALKTSGVTGTGWAASISVMEYRAGALATPVVIASRTTNSSAWVTISGAYTVPVNVTSVVFRVTVTDATAGTVWFDNLDFHKSGNVAQDWVGNLNNTWENMWSGQFGDGTGTGKIWSDMGTHVRVGRDNTTLAKGAGDNAHADLRTTRNSIYDGFTLGTGATGKTAADLGDFAKVVRQQADLGVENAEGARGAAVIADGKAVDVATGLRTTVGGETGVGVPANSGAYLGNLITKMYGNGASVPQQYINNVALNQIPTNKLFGDISGATITSSTIPVGALAPTVVPSITATVKASTVGSGSMLTRTGAQPSGANATGRNKFATLFFNTLAITSTDITPLTGMLNGYGPFYTGVFQVTNPGWYMCEVGFRVNTAFTAGFNIAPVCYKDGSVHKIGTDIIQTATRTSRFVQSSWIIYLGANGTFGGGYDAALGGANAQGVVTNFFQDDNTGVETYISIALLNRS